MSGHGRWCGYGLLILVTALGPLSSAAVDPIQLSRAEKAAFLSEARIIKTRELSQGITNSLRATLSDGTLTHDAHIQTVDVYKMTHQTPRGTELNFRDSYKFNIAAYRLDQILGLNMVPVCVERKVRGEWAAVSWWVDDVLMTEKQRYQKNISAPNPNPWNEQMYAIRIFDELIYNTDRNLGNVLITKDWTLWMIDHTRAFRSHKVLRNPKNLEEVRCDRKLLAGLPRLEEGVLKRQLGDYLSDSQIRGMLARRDLIVENLDRQIAQRGEENVLCDLNRE